LCTQACRWTANRCCVPRRTVVPRFRQILPRMRNKPAIGAAGSEFKRRRRRSRDGCRGRRRDASARSFLPDERPALAAAPPELART